MHRSEHPWIYGHHGGYDHDWLPGMFLSVLNTMFWVALLIGLAWVILMWIFPYIQRMIADIFGTPLAEEPSAFEILRRRYAAGEIDAITFEQMRERLEASYQQGSDGFPPDSNGYPRGSWTGYRDIFHSPGSRGQGKVKMAEQERSPSD